MWTKHAYFAGVASKDIPDRKPRAELTGKPDGSSSVAAEAQPVAPAPALLTRCASDNDGDCVHVQCPQLRDGEPSATGRSCPLYNWKDDRL